jgi:hypothetical protein
VIVSAAAGEIERIIECLQASESQCIKPVLSFLKHHFQSRRKFLTNRSPTHRARKNKDHRKRPRPPLAGRDRDRDSESARWRASGCQRVTVAREPEKREREGLGGIDGRDSVREPASVGEPGGLRSGARPPGREPGRPRWRAGRQRLSRPGRLADHDPVTVKLPPVTQLA